jgi:hypothetical protein
MISFRAAWGTTVASIHGKEASFDPDFSDAFDVAVYTAL